MSCSPESPDQAVRARPREIDVHEPGRAARRTSPLSTRSGSESRTPKRAVTAAPRPHSNLAKLAAPVESWPAPSKIGATVWDWATYGREVDDQRMSSRLTCLSKVFAVRRSGSPVKRSPCRRHAPRLRRQTVGGMRSTVEQWRQTAWHGRAHGGARIPMALARSGPDRRRSGVEGCCQCRRSRTAITHLPATRPPKRRTAGGDPRHPECQAVPYRRSLRLIGDFRMNVGYSHHRRQASLLSSAAVIAHPPPRLVA